MEGYRAALAGRALTPCTAVRQAADAFGPMIFEAILFGAVREALPHAVAGAAGRAGDAVVAARWRRRAGVARGGRGWG